ncbi:MAG: ornithine carbamoyltransferase [SAR116 cluster bacterium]|nr:ornithine carbamoyltransferase [SAR116 cluster bacterium]HCD63436.1 ornithine carbamoyltransferase [Alphaproteobacteria bacterium]
MRHFLDIKDFDKDRLTAMLETARDMKSGAYTGTPLSGRHIGMIFEKPSTRTRVSFEVGISQLGGVPVVLAASDLQLGRGETVADTAKVLSRYLDGIMIRALRHETVTELAENATVPVINGLTNLSHPCQIMADLQTIIEQHGQLEDEIVVWFGDGNNVANSWIEAAALFGFELRLAGPEAYRPPAGLIAWAREKGANIIITQDAEEAARGASVLVTDVWISMGDDEGTRLKDMQPFQVTESLLQLAQPDAMFLHCLPAVRGQEVTAGVIDGPQSAVFDEAENRLHAQKAVMAHILNDNF